ncbi:MAG: nitroreductase family protein [candidate division WOR-3 bacterium]
MDRRLSPIFARRSVRRYTGEPVTPEDIRALLEAGMAAPSASNRQPWHYVVVSDRSRLKVLAEIHPHGRMLADAAVAIAVCGDRNVSPDFWVQDCSAATENILIAAAMLGLGAVWLGVYPRTERESAIREKLRVPGHFGILCLIALGHPAERPSPRTQFRENRVHWEEW